MAQAEGGGEELEAFLPGRRQRSSSSSPQALHLLLLPGEGEVQPRPQAHTVPAPQTAADPPGDPGTFP